jgi:hypothetical protein
VLCLSVAAVFAALASPVLAKEIHVTKNFFGGGELAVERNSGLALNLSTGILYVGDTGNGRVAKFESSTGAALGTLASAAAPTFIAVDNSSSASAGDLYVLETSGGEDTITKLNQAGAVVSAWGTGGHLSGLGTIAGVAVDDSGHLWVFNTDGRLRSYASGFVSGEESSSSCVLKGQSGDEIGGSVRGISVDGLGRIYVTRAEGQGRAVNSSCEKQEENELTEDFGTAVDPTDNSVFVSEGLPNNFEISGGRFEPLEEKIGLSATNEGISREEGEGRADAGQLAVGAVGHELFAVVPNRGADGEIFEFGIEDVDPPTLEDPAVSEITATSAKFIAHINPHRPSGANPLPYAVSYEFRCTPGCPGGSGTVPGDATNHQVEFEATGLQPGTKYKVELIARNAGGTATAPAGGPPVEFTTGAVAPSVGEVSILRVGETEAAVEAQINPGGAETTYQFEYVTLAQYEASEFAEALKSAAQTLVPGGLPKQVTATIAGLLPDTRYKLRAVAANTVEGTPQSVTGPVAELKTQEPSLISTGCPNAAFRLGAGEFLPDCRAYEQATPVDKNGGSAAGLVRFVQASESGGAISFYSQAGFPGGVGAQDFATFVASRGSASWSTLGALPPQALGVNAGLIGLSGDDRDSISQVSRENQVALVYRELETNETKFIVPYRPSCQGNACFAYAGSSLDGTKVFFESLLPVTEPPAQPPATEVEHQNLYMWNTQTGQVVLVGQNASGEPLPEGSIGGPYEWLGGQSTTGGGALGSYYTGAIHAVSDDGDQAVFTEAGTGQLFARVGLDGASPSTIHVSEPQNEAEELELPAAFLEATPDGEFIFFKSYGRLTPDAGTGESEGSWNLYRYDVSTGELLDLTPGSLDEAGGADLGPEVQGLIGASSDGQVAYFVARGELVPGAEAGKEHLYRFDANRTPTITLVATLEKSPDQAGDATLWDPRSRPFQGFSKTGRISANGDAVVFGSEKSLTGYDNQGAHCGTSSGGCFEFFRWSTATEASECLTCDATGALPLGSASLASPIFNAVLQPILEPAPMLTRNLSADGTRFFFQTPDPLSARDTNADQGCAFEGGIPTCMDVYEWEAAGSGSCQAAVVANGCITLLSSGKSEEASFFGDADRKGDNAFVFTGSQLVPADRDKLYDVYDVAVNGGLASQWAGPANPCVSAEACLGQGTQAGAAASPGSASFSGPGNKKTTTKKKKKSCHQHAKKCRHKKKNKKNKTRSAAARTKSHGEEK